jgi:very-short-patch-repair endonuclease
VVQLVAWLDQTNGIRHVEEATAAGFTPYAIAAAVSSGSVRRLRRWIATPTAPPALCRAARISGRVACLSAAREHGLWTIADGRAHLAVKHGASRFDPGDAVMHWGAPVIPPSRYELVEPVVDALVRIADCQPLDHALAAWESALRSRRVGAEYLQRLPLRSAAARRVREGASQLSDSGIESIPVARLRRIGITVRQQVVIDGHPVDLLIGERLVLQVDGFEFHRTPAQRERDLAQDRRLVLMGYTVFRFGYVDVLYGWPTVESEIRHAMAAGLHRIGTSAASRIQAIGRNSGEFRAEVPESTPIA